MVATTTSKIFSPLQVGDITLQHRVVLAPLTRFRAEPITRIPRPVMEEYYEQRATQGGLLITEGTFITEDAGSYPAAPGIYTDDQIAKWRNVTNKVHKKGGYIFLQLWHIGRAAHASYLGKSPVSSSNIPIEGTSKNFEGQTVEYDVPHALEVSEIYDVVQSYKIAALNAISAGFDGVEIHAANGYLPHQFLEDGVNKRTDQYGGSIENRARFVLEIVDAVTSAVGEKRVGIRFSPWNPFQSMRDSNPVPLYTYVLKQIQEHHSELAYVHFVDPRSAEFPERHLAYFRKEWQGVFLAAGGFDAKSGAAQIEDNKSDLVAYGKHFIANPDLVRRIREELPLNKYDYTTFYNGGEKGYTDYTFHSEEQSVSA